MHWSKITRIRSIIRSSWVVCVLFLARFLLGVKFRSYHRRFDDTLTKTIMVHKCLVRAMFVSANPYSVGDVVLYKVVGYPHGSVDGGEFRFTVQSIDGEMLFGVGNSGNALMHWRTLLLNEFLCKVGFNGNQILETIF